MTTYQKRLLAGSVDQGEPGPLPADLVGLNDNSLANLDWTYEPLGYRGYGFFPVEVEAPVVVPMSITSWQAAQQLFANGGTLEAMQALVDGSGDEALKFWWSKATVYERSSEHIETLRVLLYTVSELEQFETQEGMDDFFLAASAW